MVQKIVMAGLLVLSTSALAGQKLYPVSEPRYTMVTPAPKEPWDKKFFAHLQRIYIRVDGVAKKNPVSDKAFMAELVAPKVDCGMGKCEFGSLYMDQGTIYLGIFFDTTKDGNADEAKLFELGKVNADNTIDFASEVSVSSTYAQERCSWIERRISDCAEFDAVMIQVKAQKGSGSF